MGVWLDRRQAAKWQTYPFFLIINKFEGYLSIWVIDNQCLNSLDLCYRGIYLAPDPVMLFCPVS